MSVPGGEVQQVVPERRTRLVILVICSMSLLIVALDATIVNVALPAIHRGLHAQLSGLQWTIDAYTLVLASLLMLAGSTADRIGRRRVFQIGLLTFSLGSLLCALAPSLGFLVGARVLQAIGGSMLNPVALSIIRNVFTDPRERAMAIGVWGSVFGLSMSLGPIVGGALVDSISWRAVFLVNVPIGLLAILLTARYVPESRAVRARRIDPLGQAIVIVFLASLIYAIIEAPSAGWLSAQSLSLGGVAAAALAALIVVERRVREPLIEMRFFRSAPFAGATATAIAVFVVQGGFLFINTLYLQGSRHLSPLMAGVYTLPLAVMLVLVAPLCGRFIAAHGTRLPLLAGGLGIAAGGAMLTQVTATTSIPYLFAAYVLLGAGTGVVNPPITNTAVSGMPPSMAGTAGAIASTGRQTGATLGVAVLGAIAAGGGSGAVGAGFSQATHPAWWIVCGLGVLVLGLGALTTSRWAARTAARTAEIIEAETALGAEAAGAAAAGGELVAH
jgi:EmrB/QacA subfamily drug resistance transporter